MIQCLHGFREGDSVFISTKDLLLTYTRTIEELNKLRHKFMKSFIILRIRNNVAELDIPASLRIHLVVNIKRLKLDRRDPERPRDPFPAFKISRGEGVYEVDKIVTHRRSSRIGKLEYYVI